MKYNRYTFDVTVFRNGEIEHQRAIIQLTEQSTEAMRMIVEDWNIQNDGELRSIQLTGISTITEGEKDE